MSEHDDDQKQDDEQQDEKWNAYANTVLEFPGPPHTRIDLREPVSDETLRAIDALGLAGGFAVFTAENPKGENVEDEESAREAAKREHENVRRESALERALAEAGVHFELVDGVAPDGSYREHCVAARMPRDAAAELAARLEQLALFWFDGAAFWQVAAEVDRPARRLPLDSEAREP